MMNRITGRRTGLIVAPLLLASVLAACTSPGTGGETNPSGDPDATIVVAGQYPLLGLDPHGPDGASAATQLSSRAIFSRLTMPEPDGSIVGDLAADWTSNDEGTTWTFTLKDDVRFSDGSPITAADVAASLERMRAAKSPLAGSFQDMVVGGDGAEVEITTPAPDPALPGKLTLLYVVPADTPAADGDGRDVIGSGPYVVEDFQSGDTLTLVPNEEYWGKAAANGGVELVNIPEISTRLTALQTGEVDLTWGVPDDQLPALQGNGDLVVETVPSTLVYTMWFNSSTPALADADVRNAIWQAVDFETIVTELYPESGELATSPVAPSTFGFAEQKPPVHDPEAAVAALEDAGFDFSGAPLRLQFANAQFRPFLQAVVSDLTDAGIPVELLEKEQAVFTEDLLALNWDINFQQLGNPTFDAATNLGRLYTCKANRNGYCNPELDELLAAGGTSVDPDARLEAYADATEIIWGDAVGMYPMLVKIPYAWSAKLDGLGLDPTGQPDFSTITKAP